MSGSEYDKRGHGLQFASIFTLLFTFLAYSAWISDTRFERYKCIAFGAGQLAASLSEPGKFLPLGGAC
jgi:hypothetical protein